MEQNINYIKSQSIYIYVNSTYIIEKKMFYLNNPTEEISMCYGWDSVTKTQRLRYIS